MRRDTPSRLLDAAQELVQIRGFNAFSYKDLAATVGIRTASIHYHFESKADLALALMARYQAELEAAVEEIDRKGRTSTAKLKRFFGLYRDTEKQGAICLCGSLASDAETLPATVRRSVATYLDFSVERVASMIDGGVASEEFKLDGKSLDVATALVASLQGALILSRAQGGASAIDRVQRSFFKTLT